VVIELMPSMSCGYYHKGFALHQLHDYAGAVSRQKNLVCLLQPAAMM
jgi:hypothetical protein